MIVHNECTESLENFYVRCMELEPFTLSLGNNVKQALEAEGTPPDHRVGVSGISSLLLNGEHHEAKAEWLCRLGCCQQALE